jgi:REP element-mobilizing transposase RayT
VILASHGIFAAYGFWLPNDPRGSWSDFVRSWELLRFGAATKTDQRRSVAHSSHDRDLRLAAKSALKFEPVRFTGSQARAIARGFAIAINESAYQVLACSILPDHVHVLVRRHDRDIGKILGHLKSRATQQLVAEGLHPFAHLARADERFPSVWADRSWKVFLDSDDDVARAIEYVRSNPLKEGLKEQHWSFVQGPESTSF